MKSEEAIEILTRWQEGGDITSFDDVNIAVKLAIEALKVIKDVRPTGYGAIDDPLPGETLEDGDGVHAIQRP